MIEFKKDHRLKCKTKICNFKKNKSISGQAVSGFDNTIMIYE
jgi:hypothetical protein